MNFTIDTTRKTILVNQEIIISDLLAELEKLNIDIKEYKLVVYTYPYFYPYYDPNTIICNPSYPSSISTTICNPSYTSGISK